MRAGPSFEVVHDVPFESDPVTGAATITRPFAGPYMRTVMVSVRCGGCGAEDDFRIGIDGWMRYECSCGRSGEISYENAKKASD